MVGHACSPTRIVYVDVTLTPSNVKVTELLKLRKLHSSRPISSAISRGQDHIASEVPNIALFQVYLLHSSKLMMVDGDSMGPDLQLFGARFSNFRLR